MTVVTVLRYLLASVYIPRSLTVLTVLTVPLSWPLPHWARLWPPPGEIDLGGAQGYRQFCQDRQP